jgi:hypothetical protein
MDYHVIIAKYKENISWLEEMDKSHIYLYDKGSTENNLLQGFAHYETRPNVGRESETYLYHIIKHYDNLPEYLILMQGNPFDHFQTEKKKQAIQLQANNDNISKLQNKVNFEENIRRNLENELESMKVELSRYRTEIKNITILKDNEIERLKNDLVKLNIIEEVEEIKNTYSFIQGNILPRRNAAGQRLPANGVSRRQMPSKR